MCNKKRGNIKKEVYIAVRGLDRTLPSCGLEMAGVLVLGLLRTGDCRAVGDAKPDA